MTPAELAEYKRRLALRDSHKADLDSRRGFHSSILAGTQILDQFLPPAHHAAGIVTGGNRPTLKRRGTNPQTRTIRRNTPTTKG
jgi:hypothetical protein